MSFVPKIVGMVVAVALTLPWLIQQMIEYTQDLITNIPNTINGG